MLQILLGLFWTQVGKNKTANKSPSICKGRSQQFPPLAAARTLPFLAPTPPGHPDPPSRAPGDTALHPSVLFQEGPGERPPWLAAQLKPIYPLFLLAPLNRFNSSLWMGKHRCSWGCSSVGGGLACPRPRFYPQHCSEKLSTHTSLLQTVRVSEAFSFALHRPSHSAASEDPEGV